MTSYIYLCVCIQDTYYVSPTVPQMFTFVCVVSSYLQHTYAFQLKMQQKQDMVLWLYEEKTQTLFTQADDMYHYNHPDL